MRELVEIGRAEASDLPRIGDLPDEMLAACITAADQEGKVASTQRCRAQAARRRRRLQDPPWGRIDAMGDHPRG